MGSSQSSNSQTINETVNEALTKALQANSSNCSQNNSQNQTIDIGKIHVIGGSLKIHDIGQKAIMAPNMSCLSSNTQKQQVATSFKQALEQGATAENAGTNLPLSSSSSSTTTINRLTNRIGNIAQTSNLFSCIQDNTQSQITNVKGITIETPSYCSTGCSMFSKCDPSACKVDIGNISQSMISNAVAKCVSENKQIQSAIADVVAETKQQADSSNIGLFGITPGMIKYIAIAVAAIVICIVLGIIIVNVVKHNKSVPKVDASTIKKVGCIDSLIFSMTF